MQDDNDISASRLRDVGAYEFGRLHARVDALESRVGTLDILLKGIDEKTDKILLVIAEERGERESKMTLIKYGIGIVTAIGGLSGVMAGLFHFLLKAMAGDIHHG